MVEINCYASESCLGAGKKGIHLDKGPANGTHRGKVGLMLGGAIGYDAIVGPGTAKENPE